MLKNTQCSSQKHKYSKTVESQKFRCFSDYETAKFVENLKLELQNHFNQIPEITPANFNEEFNIFNEVILKVVNKMHLLNLHVENSNDYYKNPA